MAAEHHSEQSIHVTAEQARGGEVILRTRGRRVIFLAGLVGVTLLALVLTLLAYR